MPIIGLHSLFNACSIMYIITPYRTAVINIVKKILRFKKKSIQNTVENTNSYTAPSPRRISVLRTL